LVGPRRAPTGTAKDRALRLLGVRWRSRHELEQRLAHAGFEPGDIESAIADLERAGLVDDDRFAGEVARDQAGRKLVGNRAVRSALAQKGVARSLVDQVVSSLGDEDARALELARRKVARLSGLEPRVAARRLYGLLVRRGYGPDVARDACRRALEEPETAGASPDDPA
jgi:regulatory protein